MIKLKSILLESTALDRWTSRKSYEEKAKYLAKLKADVGLEKERDDYYDYLYKDRSEEPELPSEEEPVGKERAEWDRMGADERKIALQKIIRKNQMQSAGQKVDPEDTSLWTDEDWYNWELKNPNAIKRKVAIGNMGSPGESELAGQRAKTGRTLSGNTRTIRARDPEEYRGKPIKNINYHPKNKPAALWKPPGVSAKEKYERDINYAPHQKQYNPQSFADYTLRHQKTMEVVKEILNRIKSLL